MENNNQHNIDQLFSEESKSAEEHTTFPSFEKVWSKIKQKLDEKKDKKQILPIWFPYGIAASLVLGFGVVFFYNHNSNSPSRSNITHNPATPKIETEELNPSKVDGILENNIQKEIAAQKSGTSDIVNIEKSLAVEIPKIKVPEVEYEVACDLPKYDEYRIAKKETSEERKRIEASSPLKDSFKAKDIEGVVVTAMGMKRKSSTLGYSTTSIQSAEIKSSRDKGFFSQLQGKVAGVQVNSGDYDVAKVDDPIRIRGSKSLTGKEPLVVLDGIPFTGNILGNLDASKIKSVQVLKDASATSLYGSRGANGVIIIESKNLTKREKRRLEKSLKRTEEYQQFEAIENSEEYDAFEENQFESVKSQPLSTFSIDVDKASYANVRRMINNHEKVDKNAVRIEEMVNYFKYTYPQPTGNNPFSINTEYNVCPWNSQHKLLKIGLQGKEIPKQLLPPSNFVFLIDVSGSMNGINKLPLLKSSFKVLLESLRPEDKVSMVVYAGSAGVVLPPTNGNEKEKILKALDQLSAGGSTAGGAGIELAYKLAQENFIKDGNNRVILATDGDFNVGTSSVANLETLIEEKRQSGVFLTCLGFGMGNYKDNRMETLADKGNGNYAYIDSQDEADKFLGREFAGSMFAIAKDVKIQIEFNPSVVQSYRLIGYENRKLRNEDFKNDKIDAGELGSGHTVTALYEIIPVGVNSDFLNDENLLKYSQNQTKENPKLSGELATIKFRYKKPDEDQSQELQQVVKNNSNKFGATSTNYRFASSVAWFGLILRDSQLIPEQGDLDELIDLAKQGKGPDKEGYREDFIKLVEAYILDNE